ncbi:hypothetical protein AVEN_46556-1, partial [Araneus ventricosus]
MIFIKEGKVIRPSAYPKFKGYSAARESHILLLRLPSNER